MLFLPRQNGQGLVEYALVLAQAAIVVIAILLVLGPIIARVVSLLLIFTLIMERFAPRLSTSER